VIRPWPASTKFAPSPKAARRVFSAKPIRSPLRLAAKMDGLEENFTDFAAGVPRMKHGNFFGARLVGECTRVTGRGVSRVDSGRGRDRGLQFRRERQRRRCRRRASEQPGARRSGKTRRPQTRRGWPNRLQLWRSELWRSELWRSRRCKHWRSGRNFNVSLHSRAQLHAAVRRFRPG
jgi:hypothetical protein